MVLLLAIPIGILVGTLLGGRVESLTQIRFRWSALAVAGLLVQVVLFTPTGGTVAGGWEPALYVVSTAAVLIAVVANLRLAGMWIVAIGALSNLAAVVANGGAMPADPAALSAAGLDGPGTYTNSVVISAPALRPLTDVFAVPAGLPLANVFSVGDVLIAIGIVVVISAAMHPRTREVEPAT